MATQGEPTAMNFNSDTSAFTGTYTVNTDITAPTVVYLNSEYWYPNGYTYTLTANGTKPASKQYTVDATDPQELSITFTDKALAGKVVTIAVTAKSGRGTEFTQ